MNNSLELAEPESPEVESTAQRILIAEDEAILRHLAHVVLTKAGYETHCVADGAEALTAVQSIPFDLVITDNSMPNLTGVELIQKLRAANEMLPVILASGSMPRAAAELGVTAVLQKPYSSHQLLQTVQGILGFQRSAPTSASEPTGAETLKSLQRLFLRSKIA